MTGRGLTRLSSALRSLAGAAGLDRAWQLSPIFSSWADIVGDRLAAVTHPQSVAGKTLHVATRNSAWSHQLTMLKPQLLQRINAALPDLTITDIRFSVTPFPASERSSVRDEHPERTPSTTRHRRDSTEDDLADAFARLIQAYSESIAAEGPRTDRCSCGALVPSPQECPACRFSRRQKVLAAAEALIRADPRIVRDPSAVEHGIPPDALFEAWANIEARLLTLTRVAQTIVGRGQEIPPSLRETIETLIIARTGKSSSEAAQHELISVIGERLAAEITKR